jgi:hypothetical protein
MRINLKSVKRETRIPQSTLRSNPPTQMTGAWWTILIKMCGRTWENRRAKRNWRKPQPSHLWETCSWRAATETVAGAKLVSDLTLRGSLTTPLKLMLAVSERKAHLEPRCPRRKWREGCWDSSRQPAPLKYILRSKYHRSLSSNSKGLGTWHLEPRNTHSARLLMK